MAETQIGNIDQITEDNFLRYSAAVIKSRALPKAEDNLKPVHRKILYTMKLMKLTSDKEPRKSMAVVGEVLKLSPHGDAATYGAAVRLAQWWKLRYPLAQMQGNCGNLLGDSASAARYTNLGLSKIGDLMLEDIDKDAVSFKPNYDETMMEPVTLPSKFPFILCGNNSGIAVGMSSDIVSHNFTEVAAAIKYYLSNPNCSIADLMQYIKGPDFPTGGKIINGQDLLSIYSVGSGSVKIQAHYDVVKLNGGKHKLIFHDIPYGVEIDSGVKAPLKKLVVEEGLDYFEDIDVSKVGPHNFDITITISKNVDPAQAINTLFAKTRLQDSVKINNTFIIDGEPRILNLKQMIVYWVSYRNKVITNIAKSDAAKTNHKLTIVLGLQKCMSNIDKLIELIRSSSTRAAAKSAIQQEFSLNDEQADAVLDMKLSRLNKLDLAELNDQQKKLEEELAHLRKVIDDPAERSKIIIADLDEIKKIVGEDKRLTEIQTNATPIVARQTTTDSKKIGVLREIVVKNSFNRPVSVIRAADATEIYVYDKNANMKNISDSKTALDPIGAFVKRGDFLVSVSKNGLVKLSSLADYKGKNEAICKLKDGDELIYASSAADGDYLFLFDGEDHVLKLRLNEFKCTGKKTVGVLGSGRKVVSAVVAKENDYLLFVNKENQGKLVSVSDFSDDVRSGKGQKIAPAVFMRNFDRNRNTLLVSFKNSDKEIKAQKISVRTKDAAGALISSQKIVNII